ncbi:MAG: type II toxin-antitoxin system RelE/ParE family toxin [Sedimenticola sp.]
MIGSFTLTRKAREDLKSISAYTQRRWGNSQRRIYAKQFDDVFHMLADNPDAGNSCDYIKGGYKKFPNSSHIILYRILIDDQIDIVRILHKRMDVRSMFAVS